MGDRFVGNVTFGPAALAARTVELPLRKLVQAANDLFAAEQARADTLAATLAARDERVRELEALVGSLRYIHEADQANIANLSRKLAEAQAEVAALREVAGLVREWQAAAQTYREAVHDDEGPATAAAAAIEARWAIEARLLAATLPEVSRG